MAAETPHYQKRLARGAKFSSFEFLYYFSFGIYIVIYGLSKTNFEAFFFISVDALVDGGRLVCALLLIGKLLIQRYTSKQLLGLMVVGAVVVISLYFARDWNLVLLYLFVAAGQGISIRKLAIIALPIQLAILLITATFAGAGIIESRITYRTVGGVVQLRSSMGYAHPNTFGNAVLSVCCSYAILRFPRFNFADLLVYVLGITIINLYADSQTSMICIGVVALFALCSRLLRDRTGFKGLAFASAVIAVFTVVLSYYMMVYYSSNVEWMQALNSMLSSRFSLAKAYYTDFPPTLFGRNPDEISMVININYVQHFPDNAYIRLLITDGILPTVIFLMYMLLNNGKHPFYHKDDKKEDFIKK